MEIKRRLNKIASRITPQIEVMNVAEQMRQMCDRFDELLNYAEEKVARAAERTQPLGVQAAERIASDRKVIEDHQKAESDENLRDQKEAFDERNRRHSRSMKPEARPEGDVHIEVEVGDQFGDGDGIPDPFYGEDAVTGEIFDPAADAPQSVQDGTADDEPSPKPKPVKKKAKKKAAKKKAKKKTS